MMICGGPDPSSSLSWIVTRSAVAMFVLQAEGRIRAGLGPCYSDVLLISYSALDAVREIAEVGCWLCRRQQFAADERRHHEYWGVHHLFQERNVSIGILTFSEGNDGTALQSPL